MDIWSHYTPYPFNQIPRSYSFMVAHPALWRFNYYLQQPRWVHVPTQRMWAPFVSRQARPPFTARIFSPGVWARSTVLREAGSPHFCIVLSHRARYGTLLRTRM